MPTRDRYSYYVCPSCGAEVRVGSPGCPVCQKNGGKPTTTVEVEDEIGCDPDLAERFNSEGFDYEGYLEREFGARAASPRRRAVKLAKIGLAIVTLTALAWLAFGLA